jgi:hypothetical protein
MVRHGHVEVVEIVLQHGGDAGDGQRIAHRARRAPRFK